MGLTLDGRRGDFRAHTRYSTNRYRHPSFMRLHSPNIQPTHIQFSPRSLNTPQARILVVPSSPYAFSGPGNVVFLYLLSIFLRAHWIVGVPPRTAQPCNSLLMPARRLILESPINQHI